MIVFRVSFLGSDLTCPGLAALAESGAEWEGTESSPAKPHRHRALVEAPTAEDAASKVQSALTSHGSFAQFSAVAVKNALGEVRSGPYYRRWEEIDWQAPDRASLSEREQAVLFSLADAGEPTWIVAKSLDTDRAGAEAVLHKLEERNVVHSTLEHGGEPSRPDELDRWWAITDQGWDMLGLIRSPRYH